jgi:guanyl-specific ribonuclease Sa
MTAIQETVTIPRDRHIHLDLTVPDDVPYGKAQVMLVFAPLPEHSAEQAAAGEGSPPAFAPLKTLEECKQEAAAKTAWRIAHPEEFKARLREVQEGGPFFGGIDGMEFQKRCRDEWPDHRCAAHQRH